MAEIKLARLDEIPEGGMTTKEHDGTQVLLARCGGRVYAINDVCTHEGAPLHEGTLGQIGECMLTCPWHAAHFDLRTGKVQQDTPWATDTQTFPVRLEGNDIFVEISG
jgi:nitrite reductase/ring-hydroxylating ferredoxin subunit